MAIKISEGESGCLARINEIGEPVFLEASITLEGNLRIRVDNKFVLLCNAEAATEIVDAIRLTFQEKRTPVQ